MSPIVLQYHSDPLLGPCNLCGRAVKLSPGLQLCACESRAPVCESCGRKAAPTLAALTGLVDAAERVGRIVHHGVSPPLTALLELARAAESFLTVSK